MVPQRKERTSEFKENIRRDLAIDSFGVCVWKWVVENYCEVSSLDLSGNNLTQFPDYIQNTHKYCMSLFPALNDMAKEFLWFWRPCDIEFLWDLTSGEWVLCFGDEWTLAVPCFPHRSLSVPQVALRSQTLGSFQESLPASLERPIHSLIASHQPPAHRILRLLRLCEYKLPQTIHPFFCSLELVACMYDANKGRRFEWDPLWPCACRNNDTWGYPPINLPAVPRMARLKQ